MPAGARRVRALRRPRIRGRRRADERDRRRCVSACARRHRTARRPGRSTACLPSGPRLRHEPARVHEGLRPGPRRTLADRVPDRPGRHRPAAELPRVRRRTPSARRASPDRLPTGAPPPARRLAATRRDLTPGCPGRDVSDDIRDWTAIAIAHREPRPRNHPRGRPRRHGTDWRPLRPAGRVRRTARRRAPMVDVGGRFVDVADRVVLH